MLDTGTGQEEICSCLELKEYKMMKVYYSERNVRIFNGDVVETLNSLPEECIDLIFADPPYNLSNGGFTCHAGKRVSVNKGKWDKSKGIDEDFEFHYNWIESCKRVLKPNGSLWISGTYHSIYACGFALQKQGWHLINDICWFKPNAAPNLACRMFTASHETLLWVRKDKKAKHFFNYDLIKAGDWNGDFLKKPNKQMRSVWAIATPKNGEKKYGKHPTQKPESLLDRIVLACSKKNDIVLDPFCGSATTGVSSLKNGRKFVGIDAEKDYLDKIAIPRIKDVFRQNALFTFNKKAELAVSEKHAEYGLLP
jgi:site-specific DNA-methyltransferase (adenine-specific)